MTSSANASGTKMRRLSCSIGVRLPFCSATGAQAPAFDAASRTLTPPLADSPHLIIGPAPAARGPATHPTVRDLLRARYPQCYFRDHAFGGPDWASRTRSEINATTQGNPALEVLDDMARELLDDRFGLHFHVEDRPVDVWAVVIAPRTGTLGRGL